MGYLMICMSERSRGLQGVGSSLGTMTQEFDRVQSEITRVADAMQNTRQHSQTVADSLRQLEQDVDEDNRNMHDLSVPIYVQGKHWGGFRIGYQPERDNAQQNAAKTTPDTNPATPLALTSHCVTQA